jgi:hypothetical protein
MAMSGRDLVGEMRGGDKMQVVAAPRGGSLDLLLTLVVIVAIGSAGFFGVRFWLSQPPVPASPPPAEQASIPANAAWTDADNTLCQSKAMAAANEPLPAEMALANRAVTEGFAGFSARLECSLSRKSVRFCDPAEKAKAVAAVNDYLSRIDIVMFGLGLQGAPMRLMGTMLGGEIEGGSAMYDETKEETITFMAVYQKRVAAALQKLARDGIIAPADFNGPLGMGASAAITDMFGGVEAKRRVCS